MAGALLLLSFPFQTLAQPETIKIKVEGRLVDGFPPLPEYPGARVKRSEKRVSQNKTGFEADLVTRDSVFYVYIYYLDALRKDGWDIFSASENSPTAWQQGIGASKNGMRAYFSIERESDGTTEIEIEIPLQAGIGQHQ